MRHVLFGLFLICLSPVLGSNWVMHCGGITPDEALDIASDSAGYTYTTGYFSLNSTFGLTSLTCNGVTDVFIVKSNPNGTVSWAVKAGGAGADKGLSVKSNAAGDVFVTGYYSGTATFGATSLTSAGIQDIFIAKYNTAGVLQWVRSAGGTMNDQGNGISVDPQGNVYVTGEFAGTCNFGASSLTSMINPSTSSPSVDVFTAKYDPSGNLLWVKKGSAELTDRGIDIASDNLGNSYVLGQFSDTITFDLVHNNTGYNAAFLIKYDASGNEVWFHHVVATVSVNMYGIELYNNQSVYITGDFKGNLLFIGPPVTLLNATQTNNVVVAKYDTGGNLIWTAHDGSASAVSSRSIDLDAAGNVYITGQFRCTFDDYAAHYGTGIFNNVGFNDIFIASYDSNGTWLWARQFAGRNNDLANGIIVRQTNDVVIVGSFENDFFVPWSGAFLGYGQTFVSNTSSTICSDANYPSYRKIVSYGNLDALIACPVDINRSPYDYFVRSAGACDRPIIDICIGNPCVDTLVVCGGNGIQAYPHTAPNGPAWNFLWSTGSLFQTTFVTTTDDYSITATSADGCYTRTDTAYVVVNPIPVLPAISDNFLINVHDDSPQPIDLCNPNVAILWADTMGYSSYGWSGPGITAGNGEDTISTSLGGQYIFTITSQYGCQSQTPVFVTFSDPPPPVGLKLDMMSQPSDSMHVCIGSGVTFLVYDSISNPLGAAVCVPGCTYVMWTFASPVDTMPGGSGGCPGASMVPFFPDDNGWHLVTAKVFRSSACTSDTIIISHWYYFSVDSAPNVTSYGDYFICPGDTTVIYGTGADSVYYWYGSGILGPNDNDSAIINQLGNFTVVGYNTHGCPDVSNFTIAMQPQPHLNMNPLSGLLCPGGFVTLSVDSIGTFYDWWGPSGQILSNTQSINVSQAGYYYCIVSFGSNCSLLTNTIQVTDYSTATTVGVE